MRRLLPLLLAWGCTGEPEEPLVPVPFTPLEQTHSGADNGIYEKVVLTSKEWTELWANHARNHSPTPPAPKVDFSKEVVLALAWGWQGSSGYDTKITRIGKTENEVRVFFKRTGPSRDEPVLTMITHPYYFARMEKPDLPVRFVPEKE